MLTFPRPASSEKGRLRRLTTVSGISSAVVGLTLTTLLLSVMFATARGAENWEQLAREADSLAEAGQFDPAASVGMRCLEAMRQAANVHDTLYADRLFEVGRCNWSLNRIAPTDSLWQIALQIREQYFRDDHPAILQSLRYLSAIYLRRGDYAISEGMHRRMLVAWEDSDQRDTSFAVNMLTRLGVICMNQQRASEAAEAYERALTLLNAASTPDVEVARALCLNMAYMYADQKEYAKAESAMLSLIDVLETADGSGSDYLAAAYLNLAELHGELGHHDEAEVYFRKCMEVNERLHGPDSYEVAIALTSYGNHLMGQGLLVEAGEQYARALRIKQATVGPTDRTVANTLVMYSQCEREMGNVEKALRLAQESFAIRRANFVDNYWVLPESDAIAYSQVMRGSANAFFTAFADRPEWDDMILCEAANVILACKGQVTDCMFNRRQSLFSSDDPELAALMDQYRSSAKAISQLYGSGPGGGDVATYSMVMDSLAQVSRDLEEQMALSSESFQAAREFHDVSWDKVQPHLPINSVLIEFARFELTDLRDSTVRDHYFALVLPAQGEPRLKHLGPAAEIDLLVADYRRLYENLSTTWPSLNNDQIRSSRVVHRALYERLIAPVEQYVTGAELLLLAPDGSLNLVAFAGLQDESDSYFIEKHALHYLAAGRDLVRLKSRPPLGAGLLAFGGIDFDSSGSDEISTLAEPQATVRSSDPASADQVGIGFRGDLAPLPYTGREVTRVAELWRESRGGACRVVTGSEASEERFKLEAPGKRVIHCATHGFFGGFSDPSNEAEARQTPGWDVAENNPMVKSGLFFAGVNNRATGGTMTDDGFLTALEVAGMDLQGVEWVVLSACGSGLGGVQTGEGVYGLRRAFLMAGVRTVISSLWSIPDKQTAALMEQVYSGGESNLATLTRRIALEHIREQRQTGKPDHPFAWGAFVAVGDWMVR